MTAMPSFLGKYAVYAFAIGGTILAIAVYIVTAEDAKDERDALRDYHEGTEDARDAQDTVPDDDSLLPGWLRDFANGGQGGGNP